MVEDYIKTPFAADVKSPRRKFLITACFIMDCNKMNLNCRLRFFAERAGFRPLRGRRQPGVERGRAALTDNMRAARERGKARYV
jgi:hypothetical protein